MDYICNPDNLKLQVESRKARSTLPIRFSYFHGVGVQTVADLLLKKVCAACDTQTPGFQGVTLRKLTDQCGMCFLNNRRYLSDHRMFQELVNGQCGGAKDGMCEVIRDGMRMGAYPETSGKTRTTGHSP